MKIIVSMDSYKGSCSAHKAGEAVQRGIKQVFPDAEVVNLPVADGGEGTVEAIIADGRGERHTCHVTGPLGDPVEASYGVLPGGIAVLEMSSASGLTLISKEQLDPLKATTYGTGEMILAALDEGYRTFLIGLGGSATNDGGAGMAQALGVSLQDAKGCELPYGGASLADLACIDMSRIDPRLKDCSFTCAVDVSNVLCGPDGATAVYGFQKGVTTETLPVLDNALKHFAEIIRRDVGVDVLSLCGGGAAGGLGAGLYAFCGASFQRGIDAVLDIVHFDEMVQNSALVFTGEGHMDSQTVNGKVPVGVAQHAKNYGPIPVLALVGGVSPDAAVVYNHGIDGVYAISDGPITFAESCRRVEELLERCAAALMHTYLAYERIQKKEVLFNDN